MWSVVDTKNLGEKKQWTFHQTMIGTRSVVLFFRLMHSALSNVRVHPFEESLNEAGHQQPITLFQGEAAPCWCSL